MAAPSGNAYDIICTRGTIEVIGARGTIDVFHPAPFRVVGILGAFDIRDRTSLCITRRHGSGESPRHLYTAPPA